jgi:transposase InsO family protein
MLNVLLNICPRFEMVSGLRDSAEKPRLHNDNGSQLKAKKLRQWLRELGVLQDFSRPKVPENLAILERFMRTVKQEEVYPGEYPEMIRNLLIAKRRQKWVCHEVPCAKSQTLVPMLPAAQ